MSQKINVVTLGCSKNIVDSEVLMGQLKSSGVEVIYDSNDTSAKTVVINTCGFINDAKEESVNTILQFVRAKEAGDIDNLYVMGCLSERYKKELEGEITEVDKYFGVNDIQQIVETLNIDYKKELIGERFVTTSSHYAYLKISEGCDRNCSFCAIPDIRGKHISKPIDEIIIEAKKLQKKGVKELILIAQDLTYYGLDIYKENKLKELLEQLSDIDGIEWIRLHYAYPSKFPFEILKVMKEKDNICNYLDIPFQHISDSVLSNMRRGIDKSKTLELIEILRSELPDLALRTTLMVGHPGETEKEFEELKQFVINARFDRLGVFTYSEEENTFGAEQFDDIISDEVKNNRSEEIMAIQQEISRQLNAQKNGKILKVIIDREEGDYFIGRTEFDSPEVDNEVLINKSEIARIEIGTFYSVKITTSEDYDLFGDIVSSD